MRVILIRSDEAVEFVEQIRAQHPKARHVCFAVVTGASQAQFNERVSDDGEPSGTTGKPILNVLRQSETTDTVIAVTRLAAHEKRRIYSQW